MFDVLLINLPTSAWYKKQFRLSGAMPPLGLLYIGTVLQKNHFKTKLIDLSVEDIDELEFEKYLLKYKPKVVGISTYSEAWMSLKVISKKIKEILPQTVIVAGGAFATFSYEDVLNKTKVDMVSVGEGEYTYLKLCNSIINGIGSIEEITGLIVKKNNDIDTKNAIIQRIEDLDSLPFVNRELLDIKNYDLPFTISTARGCPGACIFCSSRAFWGKKVYMRSAENIFDEINYIYDKYNSNVFQITDDTFTASQKRANLFCDMILKSDKKFIWACESRADVINEDFIKKIRSAGCNKIQFGMESADNDILKKLKKFVTIEQIENALKLASKENMYITLSFIIGHAYDTHESILKTFDFVKKAQEVYGASVAVSINTPFPGTEQYDNRDELGIKIANKDWNVFRLDTPNISTETLPLNDLRKYYAEALILTRRV